MLEHAWNHPAAGSAAVETGCAPQGVDHLGGDEGARPRFLAEAWVSEELLADTMAVWSKTYGRPVGREEAMEILANIKHYAAVLLQAAQEMSKP